MPSNTSKPGPIAPVTSPATSTLACFTRCSTARIESVCCNCIALMIETYAYARAGLLGNPSDGYNGKTIAFLARNFRARVLLATERAPGDKPFKADMPVFESLDDLHATTRWRGYYGGIRIIQALIVRFMDYCRDHGIELENRNFTIEYESTIPLRLGMGGSSAIITAALRALIQYFQVEIPTAGSSQSGAGD